MTHKTGWLIFAALVAAAGFLYYGYFRADVVEWEILNRLPSTSVADSKRLGVYMTNLNFSPAQADLGDTLYTIDEVWAEHSATVERPNLFTAHQKNLPEIMLCVRIHATGRNQLLAPTGIIIATGKASRTYGVPLANNLCVDAGLTLPSNFSLASLRGTEIRIALSQPK